MKSKVCTNASAESLAEGDVVPFFLFKTCRHVPRSFDAPAGATTAVTSCTPVSQPLKAATFVAGPTVHRRMDIKTHYCY